MRPNPILGIDVADSATGRELGDRGELIAADFIESAGCRIVLSNFTVPVGRNTRGAEVTGEIDLVALDGGTLCFVEVKTRRSNNLFEPSAAVTLRKQRQITRTARIYRRIFDIYSTPYRYDVVSIVLPVDGEPFIEHLKGFWDESKFRKRNWHRGYYGDLA
jgi:putative endonuclease